MSPVDLKSKEGRKSLISNNLDDLIVGVNDTYGPIILEELLKRIESTINEFNDEINNAFDILKNKDIERKKLYKEIKNNDLSKKVNKKHKKTEWEKKIEEIESSTK